MKTILSLILVAAVTGCGGSGAAKVEADKEELQLSCSMRRTEFCVGEELCAPKVTLGNNTDTDVDLIGPTITMPTGLDPRRMPPRKLKARTTIEFTPDGIWYYEEERGFEPYVFRHEGTYELKCTYEGLDSNTITITVRKN